MSERRWSVETLSRAHPRIAIDSNVLIYLLEEDGPRADRAAELVDAIEAGRLVGILSTVGLTEILTGPARAGDGPRFEQAADEVRSLGLRLVPVDVEIAEDAAWIRGAHGLSTADAIHLASARAAGATLFITNDRRIKPTARLEVAYLDEMTA